MGRFVQLPIADKINTYEAETSSFVKVANINSKHQKDAVDFLVKKMKTFGLFDKFYYLFPFVGGNTNAHKVNLKNPYTNNMTFGPSAVHSEKGVITGNTLSTVDFNSSVVASNNFCMHIYIQNDAVLHAGDCNIGILAGLSIKYDTLNNNTVFDMVYPNRLTVSIPTADNLICANSLNGVMKIFHKGEELGARTSTNFPTFSANPGIGDLNTNTRIYSFYGLSKGLTNEEQRLLYNTVHQFQNMIDRGVKG